MDPQGIAGYRFEKLLGKGGMGAVYRSVHPRTGAPVAVKVILQGLRENEAIRERFKREIRAMSMVEHPNLVRILDTGEETGQAFYVMDLVEGEDLASRLNSQGALSLEALEILARGLFSALAALHDAGIIHRDLKPQNVMMTKAGIPLIMDFGLTKLQDLTVLTKTGALLGSPRYMAPEMLTGGAADSRSDLYQAGLILWESAAGAAGFWGESLQEVALKIASGDIPDIREKRPDLPENLALAIEGALEVEPEERLQTGHQVLRVLDGELVIQEPNASGASSDLATSRVSSTAPLQESRQGIFLKKVLPWLGFLLAVLIGFQIQGRTPALPEDLEMVVGLDRVSASWRGAEGSPCQLVLQDREGELRLAPGEGPEVAPRNEAGRSLLISSGLPPGRSFRASLRYPGGETLPRTLETPPGLYRKGFPRLIGHPSGSMALELALHLPVSLELRYRRRDGSEEILEQDSEALHQVALSGLAWEQTGTVLEVLTVDATGSRRSQSFALRELLEEAGQRLIEGQGLIQRLRIRDELARQIIDSKIANSLATQSRIRELVIWFQPLARAFFLCPDLNRDLRREVLQAVEDLRRVAGLFLLRKVEITPSPSTLLQGSYFRGDRGTWIPQPEKAQRINLVSAERGGFMSQSDTQGMILEVPPLPLRARRLRVVLDANIPPATGVYLKLRFESGLTLLEMRDEAFQVATNRFRYHREIDSRDLPASGDTGHLTLHGLFFPPTETVKVYHLAVEFPGELEP